MLYTEFVDQIRFDTKTTAATLPLSDIVREANNFFVDLSGRLNEADEDILGTTAIYPLISGQREYALPAEFITGKLEKVEALLDGENWALLEEIDLNSWGSVSDEETISQKFGLNTGSAFYDIWRKSIIIYSQSIPGQDAGLKISSLGEIDPLTEAKLILETDMAEHPGAGTESWKHGVPKPFHELSARYVTISYKQSSDREIPLTEREMMFEMDVVKNINFIKQANMSRKISRNTRNISREHNYGFDY